MTEIPELDEATFTRGMRHSRRQRIIEGRIEAGEDVVALRKFVGLNQKQFAEALGVSVSTLRGWEQGRKTPEGPALAILRIAARHPKVLRENVAQAA